MFIVNLPPKKVWVRKEYLYDLRNGHGEYVLGYWVSLKSIWGRSFYFETYMPEYGACFDKLPISAFIDWDSDKPEGPGEIENDLPLSDLQYWDSFDYDTEIMNTLNTSIITNMMKLTQIKTYGTRQKNN